METELDSRLFYLVGASGSGKDSVIKSFRQLPQDPDLPVIIAHRYITREDTNDEDSVFLSDEEFLLREKSDFFSMSWQANGLRYGIGTEIDQWLASGFSVLVNGSRAYLPTAKLIFGHKLHSILVDVPEDELRNRLHKRSREDEAGIAKRLERHRSLTSSVTCDSRIDNTQAIESASAQLKGIILDVMNTPSEAFS